MNKPLVFTDFHHAGLLNSLIMLFEGRFGGQVFRPIGTDWAIEGYWHVYDHPATIQQFLGIGGATPDGTPPLNEVVGVATNPGIYHCKDIEGDRTNKAVTLEAFISMPFDIVIASIPAHIEPFKILCELHPNKPKLIYQIGNAWVVEAGLAPNIMASALINNVPSDINFVSYHQEFDLNTFFPQEPITHETGIEHPGKQIYSFVNVFQDFPDYQLFLDTEQLADRNNWTFKSFGGQCRDGSQNGTMAVANAMRESRFIWHTKYGGDGYGHIVYNTGAVGKPMIVKREYYNGKMGQELMEDGVTCIAIDGLYPSQILEKIEYYSEPKRYAEMCKNIRENFKIKVDFEKEAQKVALFLENLQ